MKKPTVKQIKEALSKNYGIMSYAADDLGIHRTTIRKYIDADTELQQAQEDATEIFKDKVEHKLLQNILEGKETSLIFYAKTKMKDRGYGQDLSEGGMTVNQQFNLTVQNDEARQMVDDIIKKISNE